MVVNELVIPDPNTTVDLYNLKGNHLAAITANTALPFVVRLYAMSGARLVRKLL